MNLRSFIVAIVILLGAISISSLTVQAATCSSLNGACKINCNLATEQPQTATGCTSSGRGSEQCCVPRSLVTPVACPGVCQSSCDTSKDEVEFRPVNDCGLNGQICCNINPITAESPLCGTNNLGVKTAIGCLMAGDPKLFVSQLLGWGVGVGGGIAFLLIVYAGFQMATAGGDPKRVQAAHELLVSAISGLLLIVFSIFLLNFIGIKILNLGSIGGPLP